MARRTVLSSFVVTLGLLALLVSLSMRNADAKAEPPANGFTLVTYLPVATLVRQETATVHVANLGRDQTAMPEVFTIMFVDAGGVLLAPEQRCEVATGQICSATLSSRDCPGSGPRGLCAFRAIVVGEEMGCVAPDMGTGTWMANLELFAISGASKSVAGETGVLVLPTGNCTPGPDAGVPPPDAAFSPDAGVPPPDAAFSPAPLEPQR